MAKRKKTTEPDMSPFASGKAETATAAVIYCRVSSDRQAKEGDGARSQEQRCRNYLDANGYSLLRTFSDDGVSGAAIARPALDALLTFVADRRAATGAPTVVVLDDISRLARDVPAHIRLRTQIRAAGGILESPSFSFGDSAADELVETIMAATAQFGRKGNREQVLNRMRSRLEQGYWTFPAPPGYRFERHPVHKKWLVPTHEAKRILGPALELYATGRFATQRELARHLRDQGFFGERDDTLLSALEMRVSRMIDAAFLYAGKLQYPDWKIARREGRHAAIIDTNTLGRIERRLATPGRPWSGARVDADAKLILRNYVRCSACGRPWTGSLARGQYPRYNCFRRDCPSYGDSFSARRTVEPSFVSLLRRLKPTDELLELIGQAVDRFSDRSQEERQSARDVLERDLALTRGEIKSLAHRIGRSGSDAVAAALEAEVEDLARRETEILRSLSVDDAARRDYRSAWKVVNTWFSDPASMWETGSETQKKTVHRMVFEVPPCFDRKQGFNTYELTLLYRISEDFKHTKARLVDLPEENRHKLFTFDFFNQITECSVWLMQVPV